LLLNLQVNFKVFSFRETNERAIGKIPKRNRKEQHTRRRCAKKRKWNWKHKN